MGETPPFFMGADMFTILIFVVAFSLLSMAHILVVVQLDQGWFHFFPLPPIYMAAALDGLALTLVYYI